MRSRRSLAGCSRPCFQVLLVGEQSRQQNQLTSSWRRFRYSKPRILCKRSAYCATYFLVACFLLFFVVVESVPVWTYEALFDSAFSNNSPVTFGRQKTAMACWIFYGVRISLPQLLHLIRLSLVTLILLLLQKGQTTFGACSLNFLSLRSNLSCLRF
jgi:hypothetical protein